MKPSKILASLFLAALATALLSACVAQDPKEVITNYGQSDKEIVDTFLNVSSDGKVGIQAEFRQLGWRLDEFNPNLVRLEKQVADAWGPGCSRNVLSYLRGYQSNASTDSFADSYARTAESRGNTVKMFSSNLNTKIGKLYGCGFCSSLPDAIKLYYKDPVLIEFDSNNRRVSFIIRAHYYEYYSGITDISRLPATAEMKYFISIYSGRNGVRRLRNALSSQTSMQYFIRDL